MGSFRSCLRQASQGTSAHPPASAGAQWTYQAGGRDTLQDPIDSAATIDRLLQMPRRATLTKKARKVIPEPRRLIKMRTFADWKEPPPGNMEMDLVAHCGQVNRGSYVHS